MQNSEFLIDKNFVRTANWYVLQVRFDSEIEITAMLNDQFRGLPYVFFVPMHKRGFKSDGNGVIHQRKMFEKYVFLATTAQASECWYTLYSVIVCEKDIFGFLHYGDERQDIKLYDKERDFLATILNDEFSVPAVEYVTEGDNVALVGGIWEDARVKKINKYQQAVIVEIEMFGVTHEMELALQEVEKA